MENTLKLILSRLDQIEDKIAELDKREQEHFNVLCEVIKKVDLHAVKLALIEAGDL